MVKGIKGVVFRQVDPTARESGLSATNRLVIFMILAAVAAAVIETEPTVSAGRETLFQALELSFGILFSVEYLLRLWVADLNPVFGAAKHPRLKFVTSPASIVDLLAIIPSFFAFADGATLMLRFVRFFRILRLARLGRFSRAWRDLGEALHSRREELFLAFSLAAFTLLIASSLLYWAESEAQPDKFGSIPRAFWWGIVTLTTVGYGDVYPVTALGKFFSALVSIAAIGTIALPTGILAAAMSDVMQRRREKPAD
ncbi:ion transporter [Sphingomonas xanthus]|uniref:Ion transporter n=1 Tax=Sphingomonas xanthus TaxID=2594473 RepID=A0A516ISI0_9SPHN|nr:ion transporter [Sphingomonas xanthus]QDP19853.1 ion transporter [Sphingomonas xanthus]